MLCNDPSAGSKGALAMSEIKHTALMEGVKVPRHRDGAADTLVQQAASPTTNPQWCKVDPTVNTHMCIS